MTSTDEIVERCKTFAFGNPIVANNYRGLVAEAIIAHALEPNWRLVSADWAAWDFQNDLGHRLEVKQTAALQSWHDGNPRRWKPRFDIATRSGRYEGATYFDEPGRPADIYVFAAHPISDTRQADQRNSEQWEFYVALEDALPNQKTIGLKGVADVATFCTISELEREVSLISSRLPARIDDRE